MKILVVSALYAPNFVGGAEKIAQVLAEGLQAAGHETAVVTTDGGSGTRVGEVNGVKVHYVGIRNLYCQRAGYRPPQILKPLWHAVNSYNVWMQRAVEPILDAEQPDLVHSHSLTGLSCSVWPAAKARGLPLVHTLHDYSLLCPRATMEVRGTNCARQCTVCRAYSHPSKLMSAHVDAVVGVSRHTLQQHLDAGYFPNASVRTVIHNGLPPPSRPEQPAQREGRGLRLGFVGRLTPTKGIGDLVTQMGAWAGSGCELLVAGRGEPDYEQALQSQAPANVRFLGFVDPGQVYRQVDVLVVPSLWHDPLPTTVIEAYQHGVPVIASRRGGLPELVEHGSTGFLFEPSQPQALHGAIQSFVKDPELASRMRPRILEMARGYTLDRMRSDYAELLLRTAGRQPVHRVA